ncbi:hypothetical protein [Peribacillus sp. NPDC060253]
MLSCVNDAGFWMIKFYFNRFTNVKILDGYGNDNISRFTILILLLNSIV